MKYPFIILILSLSFNIKAQSIFIKDTTNVVIPNYVAKQIVLDLISGDSAKTQLTTLYDIYKLVEQKTQMQDSIIKAYQIKN